MLRSIAARWSWIAAAVCFGCTTSGLDSLSSGNGVVASTGGSAQATGGSGATNPDASAGGAGGSGGVDGGTSGSGGAGAVTSTGGTANTGGATNTDAGSSGDAGGASAVPAARAARSTTERRSANPSASPCSTNGAWPRAPGHAQKGQLICDEQQMGGERHVLRKRNNCDTTGRRERGLVSAHHLRECTGQAKAARCSARVTIAWPAASISSRPHPGGQTCPYVCGAGACVRCKIASPPPGSVDGFLTPLIVRRDRHLESRHRMQRRSASGGACAGTRTATTTAVQRPRRANVRILSGTWQDGAACTDQACINGACSGVCTPGSRQCSGNAVETCDATGNWGTANRLSGPGLAAAGCLHRRVRADHDAMHEQQPANVHHASGQYTAAVLVPCTRTRQCAAGACTGACTPGTGQCDGLTSANLQSRPAHG